MPTYVTLVDVDGSSIRINPEEVDTLEDVGGTSTLIRLGAGNVWRIPSPVAAVAAALGIPVQVTQGTSPWVVGYPTGTLNNGAQTAVAAAAVQVLAANVNRKATLIQNVGIGNIRVGVTGVTAITGFRLVSGQIVIFEMPYVPTQAIFAIREGAVSSTAFVQEIT